MIAATLCVRDDADIVQDTIRNMLNQGVDKVYACTSGGAASRAVADLNSPQVWTIQEFDHEFHQATLMNLLGEYAGDNGAEWVIPFDADEYWGTLGGRNIADTLRALPRRVGKVYATLWHHQTWDDKVVPAERLPKVAYRWHPDARVHMGQHDVDMPPGLDSINVLTVRHWQFRDYAHFKEKIATWCARLPAEDRARGAVSHLTQYDGATEDELAEAWNALCDRPTVHDPIPYQR